MRLSEWDGEPAFPEDRRSGADKRAERLAAVRACNERRRARAYTRAAKLSMVSR